MHQYLTGVAAAFLEPILHGWENILDNYFSNTVFPNLSVLLFFGTILNLLFLPIVLFLDPPHLLSLPTLGIVFIISLIDIVYLFPYYWSLRHTDTSIVVALASLGKISVPIFAFFVLGEQLTVWQYVGFVLIVLSASLLSFDARRFKLNGAFFLMLGVSVILSIQAVLYKSVFESGTNWGSVIAILTFFEIGISGVIMLAANRLSEIAEDFRKIRENLKIFVLQQILSWGGNMGNSYGVSVLPVTVAQAVAGTQPLFVLGYALLFGKRFGKFFKELTGRRELTQKVLLFIAMIIGTVLVIGSGYAIDI